VYAQGNDVESAAGKYGVTETTIYDWRRAAKRRGSDTGNFQPVEIEEEDSKAQRDTRIVAMWRQHPGYGPSQIRNMLNGRLSSVSWHGAPCHGRKGLPSSEA